MTTTTLPTPVNFAKSVSFKGLCKLFENSEQDKKFNIILATLITLYLIIALIVPFIEQVQIRRDIKERLPVRLAQIILKEKTLPLPVKPKERLVEKRKIETKTEKTKKDSVKVNPVKQPTLSSKQKRELAKNKAKTSGLAAMKDELFAMREVFEILPASKSNLNKGQSKQAKVSRKLLTSRMNKQGVTLNAAKVTKLDNSHELSTRNTRKIHLSDEEVLLGTDIMVQETLDNVKSGQRSEMILRRTLEAHKARLYSRYNRALRKDPFLQGKVLFEIEIQPNGKISNINIKSSALNNDKLERQLLVILRSIAFPKENVAVMKTIWAIDFLPS